MRDRKLQRLQGYDYSRPGYYYVTLRVKESGTPLTYIENNNTILTEIGKIVNQQWLWLPSRFRYVTLDEYVIMPDHFHGILKIIEPHVWNGRDRSQNNSCPPGNGLDRSLRPYKIKPLSEIIGAFKTTSSKRIHQLGYFDFKWQKSFYDRIIRKYELETKRDYIRNNPINYIASEYSMDN